MLGRSSKQQRLFTERMSWRFLESPSCWRRTAILCRSTYPFQKSQRRGCVAARAMPASCLRQGRKGPNETTGADVRHRLDQARRFAAAPWRELPGVQPPRTCVSVPHKRGASRRSVARRDSGGTPRLEMGKWHCWPQTRIKPGFLNCATWHCSEKMAYFSDLDCKSKIPVKENLSCLNSAISR